MIRKPLTLGLIALALPLSLTACGSEVRQSLGLERAAPDEFAVVRRAPLTVPPEFGLVPPRPGASRPQEGTTRQQGAVAVFGADGTRAGGLRADPTARQMDDDRSGAEAALLSAAGASKADPNIREKVNNESGELVGGDRLLLDRLIRPPKPGDGEELDAAAERARLEGLKAEGKPVDGSSAPLIEKRDRQNFMQRLF